MQKLTKTSRNVRGYTDGSEHPVSILKFAKQKWSRTEDDIWSDISVSKNEKKTVMEITFCNQERNEAVSKAGKTNWYLKCSFVMKFVIK